MMDGKNFFVRLNGRLARHAAFYRAAFSGSHRRHFRGRFRPGDLCHHGEPLVVFTSNIFAILGLRSLYFMLAGALDKFHLLKYGLAIVLVFVGLKMVWLNNLFEDHKFPITWSLGIILGVIGISVVISLLFPKRARH